MITLKPIRDDLVEYEQTLGMQEYWDDLGSYWSDSKLEKKIAMLARFVFAGGKIEDVLERYRDGISEERASRVKPCIFRYLGALMADGNFDKHSSLYQELNSLPESDLVSRFTELLKECVKESEGRDSDDKICMNYEIVRK